MRRFRGQRAADHRVHVDSARVSPHPGTHFGLSVEACSAPPARHGSEAEGYTTYRTGPIGEWRATKWVVHSAERQSTGVIVSSAYHLLSLAVPTLRYTGWDARLSASSARSYYWAQLT